MLSNKDRIFKSDNQLTLQTSQNTLNPFLGSEHRWCEDPFGIALFIINTCIYAAVFP